ncbi:MAG: hypothetical protein COA81_01025 [Alphaproteobacteria bacterium]|nr:MAG: hypothetical protein COA81_01025 [Alphaproteobacteria bacterium]
MTVEQPHFKKPPIIEVVCSVEFEPIEAFQSAHFGDYWSRIKYDFPDTQDVAPVERMNSNQGDSITLRIRTSPPLPRVWFVGKSEHELIQLQDNRFMYNWRKLDIDDGEYPRFETVFKAFKKHWDEFVSFVEGRFGDLHIKQLELSYINEIHESGTSKNISDLPDILCSTSISSKKNGFLPRLNGFNWKTAYLLPNNCGHLTVNAMNALPKPQEPLILRLDIVATGMPNNEMADPLNDWFNLAHDWVVNGFLDVTCEDAQKNKWERIE